MIFLLPFLLLLDITVPALRTELDFRINKISKIFRWTFVIDKQSVPPGNAPSTKNTAVATHYMNQYNIMLYWLYNQSSSGKK